MTTCKYYDCGWCYAPKVIKSNDVKGACIEPEYCPYLKSQMTGIEKVKSEIKKCLRRNSHSWSNLNEQKTPVEEAYKDWCGEYPSGTSSNASQWVTFQAGYNAAYEEKVAQEPEEEPEELKTLYDVLRELNKPLFTDDVCSAVKRWMSQYTCDYVMSGEYLKGYEECLLVLKENLK